MPLDDALAKENLCLAIIVDAFRIMKKWRHAPHTGEYLRARKFVLDELSPYHLYLSSCPNQTPEAFTREGMMAVVQRIEAGADVKITCRQPGAKFTKEPEPVHQLEDLEDALATWRTVNE